MHRLVVLGLPGLAQIMSDMPDFSEGECLLSHLHKRIPSPEPNLNGECRQWRNNSCCSSDTSKKIHNLNGKSAFNHQHCGKLSDKCLVVMFRQWCLYQCDPYLQKWVINWTEPEEQTTTPLLPITTTQPAPVNSTQQGDLSDYDLAELDKFFRTHSHRLNNVPLCASDCNDWWDACNNELTCTDNWYEGFKWEQGYDGQWHNLCKDQKQDTCKPINQFFDNSKQFCEGIFPGDYRVVPDGDVCISFMQPEHNYNASTGNNSRNGSESWIGGAVLGGVGVVILIGAAFYIWKKRFRPVNDSNDDLTTSLAAADELNREVAA